MGSVHLVEKILSCAQRQGWTPLASVTWDRCAPGPWAVGSCLVPQGLERLLSPLPPPNQHRLP